MFTHYLKFKEPFRIIKFSYVFLTTGSGDLSCFEVSLLLVKMKGCLYVEIALLSLDAYYGVSSKFLLDKGGGML